jgi:hypothetical protein
MESIEGPLEASMTSEERHGGDLDHETSGVVDLPAA